MLKMWKGNRIIEVQMDGSKAYHVPRLHEKFPPERIIGVDTESFRERGILRTQLISVNTYEETQVLEVRPGEAPLTKLLDYLWRWSVPEVKPSWTEQRRDRRPGDHRGRDGRRQTVPPILLVYYNLEYDLGRLVYDQPAVLRAVGMGQDSVRVRVPGYEIEIDRMVPTGSAPHFVWYVRRDKRILRIIALDMWGYWKQGLGPTAKLLLGEDKIDISSEVEEWAGRTREEFSENEWEAVIRYAARDPYLTRQVYLRTVDLLTQVEPRVIRSDGLIPPSAASAAARMMFSMSSRETWRRPPRWVDQMGLWAYHGGRVFSLRRGYVQGLTVADISSAYPYAMSLLPDPAQAEYRRVEPAEGWDPEAWAGRWGSVLVSGEGLDPYYPALLAHDPATGRLRGVYGRFEQLWATVPEVQIGVVSGRLKITQVWTGVEVTGPVESSFLRRYVHEMYRLKQQAAKGDPLYAVAKLLLNSPYGKLVEVVPCRTDVYGPDGAYLVPVFERLDEVRDELARAYVEEGIDGVERWVRARRDWPRKAGELVPLRDVLTGVSFRRGHFFLPLHGALVTGLTAARLGLAAYCTTALQGDTDSIFTQDAGGLEEFRRIMAAAGYPEPESGLGAFEVEITGAFGLLLREKVYSLRTGDGKWKQAQHALAKFDPKIPRRPGESLEEFRRRYAKEKPVRLHEFLTDVWEEGGAYYQTRPSPRRLREAVRKGLMPGEFYTEIRRYVLEPNPFLEPDGRGWLRWKPWDA